MKQTNKWRADRAANSNLKITKALEAMRTRFSFSEFRPWKGHDIVAEFKIGAAFPLILSKLGAIETKYGVVKLNEKINTLRSSTVRKGINEYVSNNQTKTKQVRTRKVTAPKADASFDEIVIALKAKLKQEVMAELLASLK